MQKELRLLLVGVTLWIAVAPIFGPGVTAVDTRLPEKSPEKCIENPPRAVNPDNASVTGIVSRSGRNVTIKYSTTRQESGSNLQVNLPYGAKLVSYKGFIISDFGGGLFWNNSSATHSLTYNMGKTSTGNYQVRYPTSGNWLLAGAPDHFNSQVHLRPKKQGYIGGNTLYLGPYSTHRLQSGCQEFVAVVPKAAVLTGVEDRLHELKVASQALPVGHKYETVCIFVSPQPPGNVGGFVMQRENEIVLKDYTPGMKAPVLWIHEYVHTLQGFETKPELVWMYEASATYLSLRVAVEHGFISPRSYDYLLNRGSRKFDMTLTKAGVDPVAYQRGSIVLAILGRELADTHGRTIVDLLAELNEVRNPGTADVVRWLRDDVGMDAQDANHTLRLVKSDDVLNPPLVVTDSGTSEEMMKMLYQFSFWELRLVAAVTGIIAIAAMARDHRQQSEEYDEGEQSKSK